MRLRPAVLTDLDQIMIVERASFGRDSYRTELLATFLDDPEFYNLVVEEDGIVVGYVTFYEETKGSSGRIVSIAVLPQYRMRKLAREMIRAMEEEAKRRNIGTVTLEVAVANVPAINLYISEGYRIEGIIPDYYGKSRNAFYMEKRMPVRSGEGTGTRRPARGRRR